MNWSILMPAATAATCYALAFLTSVPWADLHALAKAPATREQRRTRALLIIGGLVLTVGSTGATLVLLTRSKCSHSSRDDHDPSMDEGLLLGAGAGGGQTKAARATAATTIHGRGRGFLILADGSDLARATAVARTVRWYGARQAAASASGASSGSTLGGSAFSITLLTDEFGVRAFRLPGYISSIGASSSSNSSTPRSSSSSFSSTSGTGKYEPFDRVWDVHRASVRFGGAAAQAMSWPALRFFALAHLSPYEETIFLGPGAVPCAPHLVGLFDLLRRFTVVAAPDPFASAVAASPGGIPGARPGFSGDGRNLDSAGFTSDHTSDHNSERHDLALPWGSGPGLSASTGVPNVFRPLGLGLIAYKHSDASRSAFRRALRLHLKVAGDARQAATDAILAALQSGAATAVTMPTDEALLAHAFFLEPSLGLHVLSPDQWACRGEQLSSSASCAAFHLPATPAVHVPPPHAAAAALAAAAAVAAAAVAAAGPASWLPAGEASDASGTAAPAAAALPPALAFGSSAAASTAATVQNAVMRRCCAPERGPTRAQGFTKERTVSSIGDDDEAVAATRTVAKSEMRSTLYKSRKHSTDWSRTKGDGGSFHDEEIGASSSVDIDAGVELAAPSSASIQQHARPEAYSPE